MKPILTIVNRLLAPRILAMGEGQHQAQARILAMEKELHAAHRKAPGKETP